MRQEMSAMSTTLTAGQAQALAVGAEIGVGPMGHPFDPETTSFLVDLDTGDVIDFASPGELEMIALVNGGLASVEEYVAEVNGDPEGYGVRIVTGGLSNLD
jgi:hypothetical protein